MTKIWFFDKEWFIFEEEFWLGRTKKKSLEEKIWSFFFYFFRKDNTEGGKMNDEKWMKETVCNTGSNKYRTGTDFWFFLLPCLPFAFHLLLFLFYFSFPFSLSLSFSFSFFISSFLPLLYFIESSTPCLNNRYVDWVVKQVRKSEIP